MVNRKFNHFRIIDFSKDLNIVIGFVERVDRLKIILLIAKSSSILFGEKGWRLFDAGYHSSIYGNWYLIALVK